MHYFLMHSFHFFKTLYRDQAMPLDNPTFIVSTFTPIFHQKITLDFHELNIENIYKSKTPEINIMQNSDIGNYIAVAKVIEVYPDRYTANVEIKNSEDSEFGRFLECKIQALKLNTRGAASVLLPMPQDLVYISFQNSKTQPSIIGYYTPTTTAPRPSEFQHKLTPVKNIGAVDPTFEGGANNIRSIATGDLLPGDQIDSGESGQTIGLLTGGTVIAKASNLCQMILTKFKSTAIIVSRRLKIYTDFGEITSESENGLASLNIRGNASVQKTNKYPGTYGINLRLGGKDLLFADFERKVSLTINNAGQLKIKLKDFSPEFSGSYKNTVEKDSETTVKGTQVVTVGKVRTALENPPKSNPPQRDTLINGGDTLRIRGRSRTTITGTKSETVGGAVRLIYQSTKQEIIKGVGLVATDATAYEMQIGAGDVLFNIGNPGAGGLPAPILLPTMGSFKVEVLAGEIKLVTNFGDVFLSTLLGEAHVFGGIKASVESIGISELKANITALEAEVRMLAGLTGSTDAVVTALKLTQKLLTEVIIKFNTHTHAIVPLIGPTLIPNSVMSPISPLDVSNKATLS